jgi:hypothetical protein
MRFNNSRSNSNQNLMFLATRRPKERTIHLLEITQGMYHPFIKANQRNDPFFYQGLQRICP